jgi:hypothetical protein
MAADSVDPRHDGRGPQAQQQQHNNNNSTSSHNASSLSPSFDPSLDPTIRHLFEQQAEIQAKLAALLPAKYAPNSKLELGMLRLKLRALETYAKNTSEPLIAFFYVYLILSLSHSPTHSNSSTYQISSNAILKIFCRRYPFYQISRKLERCNINASA